MLGCVEADGCDRFGAIVIKHTLLGHRFQKPMKETKLPLMQRLKQDLKNDLIAGLLVVIPLATTIWLTITVANWVIGFLTSVPKQINPFDDLNPVLETGLTLLAGLAVPLFCILLIGLMARNIAGRWLLDVGERTLQAIPVTGAVYKTLKQLLETLLRDSGNRFRRVVLVEYPRPGVWALGFVTGVIGGELQARLSGAMLSVFIPTSPNPTTGWYAIVAEEEVIDLAMSVEDAFKVIISGGIVAPDMVKPNVLRGAGRRPLEPLVERPREAIALELEEE